MRYSFTVLIATGLIVSTTVFAQSPPASQLPQTPATAQPPAQSQAATQYEKEIEVIAKRLCKAEPVVGTRIPKRRKCETQAELAAYQRQAREFIENYRRRPCIAGTEAGEGQAMSC